MALKMVSMVASEPVGLGSEENDRLVQSAMARTAPISSVGCHSSSAETCSIIENSILLEKYPIIYRKMRN